MVFFDFLFMGVCCCVAVVFVLTFTPARVWALVAWLQGVSGFGFGWLLLL